MSHKLLHRFQANNGYYNAFPEPFTDAFTQNSGEFRYLAAVYPIIEFEFVQDYEKRKRSERFVTMIQQQSLRGLPGISQWRYSRKFDFIGESTIKAEVYQ
jgi:hypothetical protein